MNRRDGLKKSSEISVDWHSYFENYKKGRHYSIDTSESKNWREYFKHQEETISIKNPVLNSADDISDEIIDNIIHNKIDTLTINYEFTKRKGESFDQQQYYDEVLKINPFKRANKKTPLVHIDFEIILGKRVHSLFEAFSDLEQLVSIKKITTSNITDMSRMFYNAKSFNCPIGDWDTSKVTKMGGMFFGAEKFNQPIGDWDTANVTDMSFMFFRAISFNQPLDKWNTGNVRDMTHMFYYAYSFNQNITDWTLSDYVIRNPDLFLSCCENVVKSFNEKYLTQGKSSSFFASPIHIWKCIWKTKNEDLFDFLSILFGVIVFPFIAAKLIEYLVLEYRNSLYIRLYGIDLWCYLIPLVYWIMSYLMIKILNLPKNIRKILIILLLLLFTASFSFLLDKKELIQSSELTKVNKINSDIVKDVSVNKNNVTHYPNRSMREKNITSNINQQQKENISNKDNKQIIPNNIDLARNPILNSKKDVTDELINKITYNRIDSLTINYEFTKCPGDDGDTRVNPFKLANRRKVIKKIEFEILLSPNVHSLACAFEGLKQLEYVNLKNTSHITNMKGMFRFAEKFNQPIGNWDTSHVTNMSYMFNGAHSFNQPIGNWDTSRVTDMSYMFSEAYLFNQSIGNWDTAKVKDMSNMFSSPCEEDFIEKREDIRTTNFNQPIGNWDTSRVTDMSEMFKCATDFNQPIEKWNTAHVENMKEMFSYALNFNMNISTWNTSSVTNMNGMFAHAPFFNQPIGRWNTSKVTDMSGMFAGPHRFNQPIGNWDTSNVTDMSYMFFKAEDFNQPIGYWNTSKVKNMAGMFWMADSFNQSIEYWDMSSVEDMRGMFLGIEEQYTHHIPRCRYPCRKD